MKDKRVTPILLLLLTLTMVTSVVTLYGQHQGVSLNSPSNRKPIAAGQVRGDSDKHFPIADINAPEPNDPEERAKRREKNRRHNIPTGVKFDPSFPLDRGPLHNNWERGLTSSLPFEQSRAVIVGEVANARTFLSEDKKNVYSEFTVQVEEVLKDDSKEPITTGGLITTERQGGRIRFPSGRIESQRIAGQGPPQVGRRYVFFLGFNPYEAGTKSLTGPLGDMRRHILTGYELREGKVFPLDVLGDFQEHTGKDATAFLTQIRGLIADALQSSPE